MVHAAAFLLGLAQGGVVFPRDAGHVDGARGDGVADDTAALQKAFSEHLDFHSRLLYLPDGTPMFGLQLQGQSAARTVIRLRDHCPGFQDPARPRPVLKLDGGNMGHKNSLFHLTIDTGCMRRIQSRNAVPAIESRGMLVLLDSEFQLGFKTERPGLQIETRNGGWTKVLGGLGRETPGADPGRTPGRAEAALPVERHGGLGGRRRDRPEGGTPGRGAGPSAGPSGTAASKMPRFPRPTGSSAATTSPPST